MAPSLNQKALHRDDTCMLTNSCMQNTQTLCFSAHQPSNMSACSANCTCTADAVHSSCCHRPLKRNNQGRKTKTREERGEKSTKGNRRHLVIDDSPTVWHKRIVLRFEGKVAGPGGAEGVAGDLYLAAIVTSGTCLLDAPGNVKSTKVCQGTSKAVPCSPHKLDCQQPNMDQGMCVET